MSDIRVIGAGFGRTGTSSLQAAFDQLGFGPAYHMREVFANGSTHANMWRDAAANRPVDWDVLFAKYKSTTDFPASCFYKELMEKYPNAKVVLTTRDFDSWYKSCNDTIYKANSCFFGVAKYFNATTRTMISETIWDGTFHGRFEDQEYARKIYEAHVKEVKRVVPEEKLLVFSVKDGWEPLCEFLGVPVPEGDFPRLNDTKEFQRYIRYARATSFTLNALAVLTPATIAAGAYWFISRSRE
mmetsp:Transcript_27391/g.42128  ORF Transcript_27391/g.42128 Transcript_27391/m.42128 type:complete len:242 (-) Transcript_27391:29-754(-)